MKEGWKYMRLGSIATYINGFAFKPSDWGNSGKPIIRIQNLTDPSASANRCNRNDIPKKYSVKAGDILISWSATLGVFEWQREEALLNQHIFKVVFDKIDINKRYFIHAISSSIDEMAKHTNGATMKHIRKGDFDNIQIPLPPLPEQQRIVEYLDSTFAEIDALKAKAAEEVANAKAMFDAALREEMTPKEGWEEKSLKEIGKTQTGTTPSKNDPENYGNFIPFVRPAELNFDNCGGIDYNTDVMLSEKGLKNGRVFEAESILMCCIGSVGKTGFTNRRISCNQQINVLTPSAIYCSRFIFFALISPHFQEKVIKIAKSAQATLPIINKGKWEQLAIYVPSLTIQQAIVARLDTLRTLVTSLEQKYAKIAAECDALKQAILKETFE